MTSGTRSLHLILQWVPHESQFLPMPSELWYWYYLSLTLRTWSLLPMHRMDGPDFHSKNGSMDTCWLLGCPPSMNPLGQTYPCFWLLLAALFPPTAAGRDSEIEHIFHRWSQSSSHLWCCSQGVYPHSRTAAPTCPWPEQQREVVSVVNMQVRQVEFLLLSPG